MPFMQRKKHPKVQNLELADTNLEYIKTIKSIKLNNEIFNRLPKDSNQSHDQRD
jgi:hypothetical protein